MGKGLWIIEDEAFWADHYPLLGKINSPDDLKKMPASDMPALAEEIREYLVTQVSETGGHLASNLGAVELTLAVHRVFSTPQDHLIFDVGHQSYIHKLLTGRRDRFPSLRQSGGISGFPKRSESEHDCFGTGHSSTSVSAALGFAEADRMAGSQAYTVCVVGDGAYTGGMIHEALNNCRKRLNLIIILNENEMSISKNIGRFARNLSHIRASSGYIWTKNAVGRVVRHIPLIGKWLFGRLLRLKMGMKAALYGSNLFESLGLYYLGPADGNNEAAVEKLLTEAKRSHQSCVIHLKTRKGKGYAPAEATPDRFHGLSPAGAKKPAGERFSDVMGGTLCRMAAKNEKICAITAAMTDGTGLCTFRATYPQRFFDVGIAEEHAVTFAAGLAANGYRPAVCIYSTFLQRAYDNILHDVALQHLPVVFLIDRAGLNQSDGPTHYGVFDVAFLSEIPDIRIYTPLTAAALRNAMDEAFRSREMSAIRYPNGCESERVAIEFYGGAEPVDIGVRNNYPAGGAGAKETPDAVIVTDGRIVEEALTASDRLASEGIRIGILLLEQIKPYAAVARQVLSRLPHKKCPVIFLEEEIRTGGMGMLLSDAMRDAPEMEGRTVRIMALENPLDYPQGMDQTCLAMAGLDADSIVRTVKEALSASPDGREPEAEKTS